MANQTTFVSRNEAGKDNKDYIAVANAEIKKNGTIDTQGNIYQNALIQYNAGLIKGSTERLEVPSGFCGYIDPATGEFRVEPEVIEGSPRRSIPVSDIILDDEPPTGVTPEPYLIDQCLANGLPGSYEYTYQSCSEDGDDLCSGILWFSGGGTGNVEGTEQLEEEICGGGNGINSNSTLATSANLIVGGAYSRVPEEVWEAAEAFMEDKYRGGGSFGNTRETNRTDGDIITYTFIYNIDDPEKGYIDDGFKVVVKWNREKEEIVDGASGDYR